MKNSTHLTLWALFLVSVSAVFSFQFACAVPLVALAAIGTLTMPKRAALLMVLAAWLANQFIGYGLLNYPQDVMSFTWGGIIGLSALVTLVVCNLLSTRLSRNASWFKMLAMFAFGFVAYEGTMFLSAVALQDGVENFTADIIGQIFAVNVVALAGLTAVSLIAQKLSLHPVRQTI